MWDQCWFKLPGGGTWGPGSITVNGSRKSNAIAVFQENGSKSDKTINGTKHEVRTGSLSLKNSNSSDTLKFSAGALSKPEQWYGSEYGYFQIKVYVNGNCKYTSEWLGYRDTTNASVNISGVYEIEIEISFAKPTGAIRTLNAALYDIQFITN